MSDRLAFQGTLSTSGGVDSYNDPDLIDDNQCAWGINVTYRGGRPRTRPGFRYLGSHFNFAEIQGMGVFKTGEDEVKHEIIIALQSALQVADLTPSRVDTSDLTGSYLPQGTSVHTYALPLSYQYPSRTRMKMLQCYDQMIIQNGLNRPVVYTGSGNFRVIEDDSECPIFDHMAFDGARLWGAKGRKIYAGDLAVQPGKEPSALSFTELNTISGGGNFLIEDNCTGMAFLPSSDSTTGFGVLIVFTESRTYAFRADIYDRDQWASTEKFKTDVFRDIGCVSADSILTINTDLYWRSRDGIRSLRQSVLDNEDGGRTALSAEVERALSYDAKELVKDTPCVYFDNRLLIGSDPGVLSGEIFSRQIVLDFKNLNSSKALNQRPVWEGEWTGLEVYKYAVADDRCIVLGRYGDITGLYEITKDGLYDEIPAEGDATGSGALNITVAKRTVPIVSSVELKSYDWQAPVIEKELQKASFWFSDIKGELDFAVEIKPDEYPGWISWHGDSFIVEDGTATVPAGDSPKNLKPGYRHKFDTPSIPEVFQDEANGRLLSRVYTAQLRVSWVGNAKLKTTMFTAIVDSGYKTSGDPSYGEISN